MKDLTFIVICLILSSARVLSHDPVVYNVDLSQFEEDDVDDFDEGYGPKGDDEETDNIIDERSGVAGNCGNCQETCEGTKPITLGAPQDSTVLCSKNYPRKYPRNHECKVDIQAPEDTWIKLTFCDFSVDYSQGCKNDRFIVLDTAMSDKALEAPCENKVQRMRKFCGVHTGRVYYVKTPMAKFRFKTNKNGDKRGFRIAIQTVQSPCYFQLQPPNGIITAHALSHASDTDFPAAADAEYRSNYYCKWNYNYGHSVDEAFQMTCDTFDVHAGIGYADISPDCVRVSQSDGSPSYYTGTTGPNHVSLGGNVSLEFFTNRQIQRAGFTCRWTINPAGSLAGFCLHPQNCLARLTCVSKMCECDAAAGYSQITYNGQDVCVTSVALGGSCDESYDCAAGDANSDCVNGVCACKSTHLAVSGRCQPKRHMNGACSVSGQCILGSCSNGRCRCNSNRCGCQSGMETTTCGGNGANGCFPVLTMTRGQAGRSFNMPNLRNNADFKFCIYGFTTGNFYFFTNSKAVRWTWIRAGGTRNLKPYKKTGTRWIQQGIKSFSIQANPDYFRYRKFGANAQLYRGNGALISSIPGINPPTKWAKIYLWTTSPQQATRKIVFIG